MAFTVAGFVAAVQTVAAGLAGIKATPAQPPEGISQYPMAFTYPTNLEAISGANPQIKRLVTVKCDILVARQLLPQAVALGTPYGDLFALALWADPTLGGTCNHLNSVNAIFGHLNYGGTSAIGWQFTIVCKQEDGP